MIKAVLAFITACFLLQDGSASAKEYYLVPGETNCFEVFALDGNDFKLISKLQIDGLDYLAWPNYDRNSLKLYFEGYSTPVMPSKIYRYVAGDSNKLSTIAEGRLPSLSPNGTRLAYYKHPNRLLVIDLQTAISKEVANDIANYRPPVWTTNTRLLYSNVSNKLAMFDLLNMEKTFTGHEMVIPSTLSPDGKSVVCSSFDATKIYIYTPSSNELKIVKESRFLSIGDKFIWRPKGNGFLYIRQTWANTLRLREMGGLFLYSLEDGSDTLLLDRFFFWGGLEGNFEKLLQP